MSEKTPEEIKAKQLKKENKAKAYEVLKALAITTKNEEMKNALITLRPSLFGISVGRIGGPSKHSMFGDLFAKVGATVPEMDIFTKLKAGRKEAGSFAKNLIKKSEPANRKWISFDSEKGIYTLIAIGENAPKDWTGYVPVSADVEDLV